MASWCVTSLAMNPREISGVDSLKSADLTVNLKIGDIAKTIPEDALKNIIELLASRFSIECLMPMVCLLDQAIPRRLPRSNKSPTTSIKPLCSGSSSTGYTTDLSNADFVKLILPRTFSVEQARPSLQHKMFSIGLTNSLKGRRRKVVLSSPCSTRAYL